jgi:flagellar biosynthesis/type III secretory pathway M-ring protein FliF/YscJ
MARPGTQLHRMQNSPHHIKVRWLIVLSIIAFAIVLILWLIAFPSMVALKPPATEANPNPQSQSSASIFNMFNANQ